MRCAVVVLGLCACSTGVNRRDAVAPAHDEVSAAAPVAPVVARVALEPMPLRFTVDVAQPRPVLAPLSPSLTPRALRGVIDRDNVELDGALDTLDDEELPFVRLEDGGALGHWRLRGTVGGEVVLITIDSGAERSLIAPELANRLALAPHAAGTMRDASGASVDIGVAALPDVVVAGVAFHNLQAIVPSTAIDPGLVLLGQDALDHVDLVVDAVAGVASIVEAGVAVASVGEDGDVVELDVDDGRWRVAGSSVGARGLFNLPFVVDTGSQVSSVPTVVGLETGIPADVSRKAALRGAAGVAVEKRGRFWLTPLSLGLLRVGDVAALDTAADVGLLGTDVLSRGRALFSPARRAVVFFAATAHTGVRGIDDQERLRIEQRPEGAFEITVSPAFPTDEVHLLLRAHAPDTGAPTGGAVDVVLSGEGARRIETGLPFASDWSAQLLPPSGRRCPRGCVKRIGEWRTTLTAE